MILKGIQGEVGMVPQASGLDEAEKSTPADGRLRVLCFTSLFPNSQLPRQGLFVRERVKALSKLCDVRVIAPVPWAPPTQWLGKRYYRYSQIEKIDYQDGLEVKHPRWIGIPKVFKTLDGLLMGMGSLASAVELAQTIKFNIIDAHWAYPDGVAAAILAKVLKLPLAITVRGDDINIFSHQLGRRQLIRWAFKTAGIVIALSEDLKEAVEALDIPASKVVVIPNGVDPNRFYPSDKTASRRRLGLPLEGRILLSVGRLHMSKGHPTLVEALALIRDKFPDLTLYIVGDPDHEADAKHEIEGLTERYGLSGRVHIVKSQPPQVLADWYRAADLFCLATSREGSANVLLEALACGLPCITTPVGGNPMVLCDPELGVLVPQDAHSIANTIVRCLARNWDRDRIVAHAHNRTWRVVAEECYSHLSSIVTRAENIEFSLLPERADPDAPGQRT
ncbi:MAG TPA: glycosyltransferase family 4 protein [Nitrospiraceae bacterium]|nr:glycosyltransferase family 4 protein [Nitrospiraceae bacterium]